MLEILFPKNTKGKQVVIKIYRNELNNTLPTLFFSFPIRISILSSYLILLSPYVSAKICILLISTSLIKDLVLLCLLNHEWSNGRFVFRDVVDSPNIEGISTNSRGSLQWVMGQSFYFMCFCLQGLYQDFIFFKLLGSRW